VFIDEPYDQLITVLLLGVSNVNKAHELGEEFAARGIRLVYGGGNVGLMGAVATGCEQGLSHILFSFSLLLIVMLIFEGGGRVTGIIPEALMPREISGEVSDARLELTSIHQH